MSKSEKRLIKQFEIVINKNSVITVYKDMDGETVLGGFGWLELYDWEGQVEDS